MAALPAAEVVATSQQSRFHTETLEITTLKDIDLKQVYVSVGDRELLVNAHLRLFEGVHYGLVGRNGTGKSTLLKSLGYGLMVGLPRSIRILYVDQLEGVEQSQRVVDVVLQADTRAQQLSEQAEVLQGALESGGVEDIVQALRQVHLTRLKDHLRDATKIATHRSGLRGLNARTVQVQLEAEVAEAEKKLAGPAEEAESLEAAPRAQSLVDHMYEELEAMDLDSAESRARSILKGLGFSEEQQDGPVSSLSGGWRMRVALAQALFMKPDLLLLDEPTNHLDLPAILWLQRYLQALEGVSLVVVSHDRAFLNAVTQEVIVLRHQTLEYHSGNYDDYETARLEKLEYQERMAESVDKKRAHVERSIQDGLRHAKKTGDDKKLGMVASRRKKLERLGMERNDAGHRFKLNRDRVGYYDSFRDDIVVDRGDGDVSFKLPQPAELRHRGTMLAMEGVAFGYKPGKDVLRGVTINLEQGEKIALIGANGEGKSTCIKLIAGDITPRVGSVQLHREAAVGFFMQHHVEQLMGLPSSEDVPTSAKAAPAGTRPAGAPATALAHVLSLAPQGTKEQDVRGVLGSLGIKGATATQPLSTLSGGQAVRVALAGTVVRAPQLLVLDEPSNHLDMESGAALADALKGYQGAVILVSHDQYLVSQVADKVYLVADGTVRLLEGGMPEYVLMLQRGGKSKKGGAKGAVAAGGKKPAAAAGAGKNGKK